MDEAEKLNEFIKGSIKAGKSFEQIKTALSDAGWSKQEIDIACAQFYPIENYPIGVPRPENYKSPRMFFLNVNFFIILYIFTYNIIAIAFTLLDYYLPDGLGKTGGFFYKSQSIQVATRDNLAVLLVLAPIIYFIHRIITKTTSYIQHPPSLIRLILIYLTLSFFALIVLVTICSSVYFFLSGELSLRFIIKLLILATISFLLYHYFKQDLNQDKDMIGKDNL